MSCSATCAPPDVPGSRTPTTASLWWCAAHCATSPCGPGSVTVVWLGRRRIAGVEPGVALRVQGRMSTQDGVRVIYNPRYELTAGSEQHG